MRLNYEKYADGLVPAIVQDDASGEVLMLGFVNAAAIEKTRETGLVTFFSRSRQELWTKGEKSGNFLEFVSMKEDCDADTVLIKARPRGPVCHTGSRTCFGEDKRPAIDRIADLEAIIDARRTQSPDDSYVAKLFSKGLNKIAQKVGEEAVELIIEAKDDDEAEFRGEAADLLFHYLVLLRAKGVSLDDVLDELATRKRH